MAIEVLQFNIAVHPQSPSSANALGDAYQKLGNPVAAREYYKMALKTDPDNEHAKRSLSEFTPEGSDSSASTLQNPEAYSDETSTPMEQLSAMMSPEQMEQVEAYMANAERMQKKTAARSGRAASSQTRMGDEERAVAARAKRCDDLAAKYNPFGGKAALAKLIGHYGASEDTKRLKTWNIDFTCEGRALWAIPLWGDVAPPQLEPLSANSFRDAWGGVWEFDIDNSGQARGVTVTDSNGRRKLIRLGAPKSLG